MQGSPIDRIGSRLVRKLYRRDLVVQNAGCNAIQYNHTTPDRAKG